MVDHIRWARGHFLLNLWKWTASLWMLQKPQSALPLASELALQLALQLAVQLGLPAALVLVEGSQRRASHSGAHQGFQSPLGNNYGQENMANPACSNTSKRHHVLHTTRKQRLHRPDTLQQSNILDVNCP